MVLHFQFIHHLLHVWDTSRQVLHRSAPRLRINFARQRDHAILHGVFYFDAVLIQHKLDSDVKYAVKSGVITLTGKVNSQARRDSVEHLAAGVPNVKQVVNELEVKNQKASSTL